MTGYNITSAFHQNIVMSWVGSWRCWTTVEWSKEVSPHDHIVVVRSELHYRDVLLLDSKCKLCIAFYENSSLSNCIHYRCTPSDCCAMTLPSDISHATGILAAHAKMAKMWNLCARVFNLEMTNISYKLKWEKHYKHARTMLIWIGNWIGKIEKTTLKWMP